MPGVRSGVYKDRAGEEPKIRAAPERCLSFKAKTRRRILFLHDVVRSPVTYESKNLPSPITNQVVPSFVDVHEPLDNFIQVNFVYVNLYNIKGTREVVPDVGEAFFQEPPFVFGPGYWRGGEIVVFLFACTLLIFNMFLLTIARQFANRLISSH